uniref:Unannotated protein n=1 Tax=freshwater metagenome TaxID=449393 RepID=A0A6J5ZZG2_9ZZZZ
MQPGDEIKVKVLEVDDERRRLSLSVKRVEGQILSAHTGNLEFPEEDAAIEAPADLVPPVVDESIAGVVPAEAEAEVDAVAEAVAEAEVVAEAEEIVEAEAEAEEAVEAVAEAAVEAEAEAAPEAPQD